jgi:soluble lytic murein transglycosylase-like protein
MRRANRIVIAAFGMAIVCLWHLGVNAAIYQCVDRFGAMTFTNAPASQSCRVLSNEWKSPLAKSDFSRQKGIGFGFDERFSPDPNSYDQHIRIISLRYGIDPFLIKAMIRTESDFDRFAVSRQGAQGLMQLMPGTSRDLNVINPFDPRENIDGGVRYLRAILDSFDGDLALSLAAYNAGPNLVKRYQRIPAIPETVDYVKRVLYYYKGYKGGKVERISLPSVIRVREMVTVN